MYALVLINLTLCLKQYLSVCVATKQQNGEELALVIVISPQGAAALH